MSERFNCFLCGEWEDDYNMIAPPELKLRDSEYVHEDEWEALSPATKKLLGEAAESMKHHDWSGLGRKR